MFLLISVTTVVFIIHSEFMLNINGSINPSQKIEHISRFNKNMKFLKVFQVQFYYHGYKENVHTIL